MGFDVPPGAKLGSDSHVLNDHTYCCQIDSTRCFEGNPDVTMSAECLAFHNRRLSVRSEDARRLGIPLIITEFGACIEGPSCRTEIRQVTEVSDYNLTSWAYWQFKTYKDLTTIAADKSEGFYRKDGTLNLDKVIPLTRPYVPAAQGTILYMRTINGGNTFVMKFTFDKKIKKPTVLYLNEKYWFQGEMNPEGASADSCETSSTSQQQKLKIVVSSEGKQLDFGIDYYLKSGEKGTIREYYRELYVKSDKFDKKSIRVEVSRKDSAEC